jgi:hypothetical protein
MISKSLSLFVTPRIVNMFRKNVSICISNQETIDTSPISRSFELTIFDKV